jgi:TPR repeat protein
MVGQSEENVELFHKTSEFERLRREAEGGVAKAQVALGHMLAKGGVGDNVQATDWYQKATNNAGAELETLIEAHLSLADMGLDGHGFLNEHDAFRNYARRNFTKTAFRHCPKLSPQFEELCANTRTVNDGSELRRSMAIVVPERKQRIVKSTIIHRGANDNEGLNNKI